MLQSSGSHHGRNSFSQGFQEPESGGIPSRLKSRRDRAQKLPVPVPAKTNPAICLFFCISIRIRGTGPVPPVPSPFSLQGQGWEGRGAVPRQRYFRSPLNILAWTGANAEPGPARPAGWPPVPLIFACRPTTGYYHCYPCQSFNAFGF